MVYRQGGSNMKIRAGIPLFFVLAVLVSGCISVRYTMLGPGYPPVPESEVHVFSWEDELPEHTRIALLHRSFDMYNLAATHPVKLIKTLSKKAGALGANGIVVAGVKKMDEGMWVFTDKQRIVVDLEELEITVPRSNVYVDAIAIRVE